MTADAISARTILRFYYPLALSWVFMGLDGPISVAVMSGLPHPQVNTAAFLILLGLAIWIESPVIDLLSTSTTLGRTSGAVSQINRFCGFLIGWVTLAHALVALTPLYGVVTRQILGVEPAVADAAHLGLILMLPWSGLIGWRRSRQGLLIRNGQTRVIGLGTGLRVSVLLVVDIVLPHVTSLSGLTVAATALIASVFAEAVFIHIVSQKVIHAIPEDEPGQEPLSMRRLVAFHSPLTATTMIKLLAGPIVAAGLARTVHPTESLAAYEVAWTVLFLFRAIAFCLPEVVIALYRDEESREALRRFSLTVGICSTATLLTLSLFRLDVAIFRGLLGVKPNLAEIAHWMFMTTAAVPLLDAAMSYVLGLLTSHHLTVARMAAVLASSVVLVGTVVAAVQAHWSAPTLAGVAIGSSLLAELAVLGFAWTRARSAGLVTTSAAAR